MSFVNTVFHKNLTFFELLSFMLFGKNERCLFKSNIKSEEESSAENTSVHDVGSLAQGSHTFVDCFNKQRSQQNASMIHDILNDLLSTQQNATKTIFTNPFVQQYKTNQKNNLKFLEDNEEVLLKIKDRLLPLANVSKIMKASVPDEAKIAKDAKATVQHSASEFIAIVTSRAKDIAASESRKVVTGDDLIKAMYDLDLGTFSDITATFFEQYKKTTNSYAALYFDQSNNGFFE